MAVCPAARNESWTRHSRSAHTLFRPCWGWGSSGCHQNVPRAPPHFRSEQWSPHPPAKRWCCWIEHRDGLRIAVTLAGTLFSIAVHSLTHIFSPVWTLCCSQSPTYHCSSRDRPYCRLGAGSVCHRSSGIGSSVPVKWTAGRLPPSHLLDLRLWIIISLTCLSCRAVKVVKNHCCLE